MSCMQNDSCISFFLVWLQACNLCPSIRGDLHAGFVTGDLKLLVTQLSLSLGVFHSATRNLIRLVLLAELLSNFLHCWIQWLRAMFRKCIPVVLPTARSLCVLDRVFSMRIETNIRFYDSDSLLIRVRCESVLSLQAERMPGQCHSSC